MILFCGDPHGEFEHIIQRVQQTIPAAVIMLGDLCLSQPFEQTFASILELTDIWFIHGNHDTDEVRYHDHLFGNPEHNLHCRVVEIDGFKIAGLGGIFRSQIWYPPYHRVTQPSKTSSLIVEKEISGEMGCHESIVVQSFPTIFRFFKDKRPISLFPMRLPSLTLTDFKLSTT